MDNHSMSALPLQREGGQVQGESCPGPSPPAPHSGADPWLSAGPSERMAAQDLR